MFSLLKNVISASYLSHIVSRLIAGKDWSQDKGVTEDEMVEWHHLLNGYEYEQTLGDSEEQGSLVCYSSWGHKELDNLGTEQTKEI